MSKSKHLLVLAAAALLLAACSATRLAYNNAGFMLTYMVDDYFDLSGDQEDWVRSRMERSISWHRTTELPEYDRFLADALARTERPITEADARWAYTSVRAYYKRLVEQVLPDASEFLLQLDDEQVARFEKRFTEESDKIQRERGGPSLAERQANRARRWTETFEGYTGKLSPQQRELIASRVQSVPDLTEMRLQDRRSRQRQVVSLVRTRPAKPQMIAELRRILVDTESWRDPAYSAALRDRDEQVFGLVAAMGATLTPEQVGQVQKKIRNYRREVSSLIVAS